MTAMDLFSPRLDLPNEMRQSLAGVMRRQRVVAAASATVSFCGLTFSILLVASLFLGFIAIPRWLRVPTVGLIWILIGYIVVRSMRLALQRWTLPRAARQIEKARPGFDEKLRSAVELLEEPVPTFRGSPALLVHLVNQAARQLGHIDPRTVVSTDRLFRQTLALMPLCIAWAVFATIPQTSLALKRGMFHTLLPWESHLPASLANMRVAPGDVTIPEADSLEISAKLASRLGFAGSATLARQYASGPSISQPMDARSSAEFHLSVEDIYQSFSYQVRTDSADSDWYSVTVHPRPTITRVELHCDYPSYSGLPPRNEYSLDGEIRTLVGTRVTLTVQTLAPIVLSKSRLEFTQGSRDAEAVPLAETAPNQHQARFIVHTSGSYRIRLINAFDLENKDNHARPIMALFDQAPSVLISAPQGNVTVPPDDVVPVQYVASDDFVIGSLHASVQVDDRPKQEIPLAVDSKNARNVKGIWLIDIAKLLSSLGAKNVSHITYQIHATDNRDPDPQTGNSAEQVLLIDAGQSRSYADQVNEQRHRRLEDAIRKALERLRQADWRVANYKNADEHHILNPDERRDAGELRELLVSASRDLSTAADEFLATPYAAVAKEAKDVADHPIANAAEDVTRVQFAADTPLVRQRSAAHGQGLIGEAAKRLEKLLPAAEQAQRQAEASEALRQATRKQQEAAEAMAADPRNVDQNRRMQQQAMNKLAEAMSKDPSLRDQQAHDLAERLADLVQKIEDDQAKQTALQENTTHQQAAHQAKTSASELAELQKKLNDKIDQFNTQQQDRLKQTSSTPSNPEDRNRVVDWLKHADLPRAVDGMKQVSARLSDITKRMSAAAAKPLAQADPAALAQAAAAAQALEVQQDELAKLASAESKHLSDAKNGQPNDDQIQRMQHELAAQTNSLRNAAQQLAERGRQQRSAELTRRAALAEKSLDAATQLQQKAASAESKDDPDQAAQEQDNAQQALASADQTLRGDAEANGDSKSQDQANSGSQKSAAQPESDNPSGQPSNAQQAAQAAQEAAAAQQQAMKPNASAARQAARALARAQAANSAAQNQRDSAQASGDDRNSQQSADAGSQSASAQQASEKDSRSSGSRSGIRGENTGASNTPPASVRDLGISAGDWAKLPPLLQQDLMNASQQTGPPAYREMIRNYYVRIATIESQKR